MEEGLRGVDLDVLLRELEKTQDQKQVRRIAKELEYRADVLAQDALLSTYGTEDLELATRIALMKAISSLKDVPLDFLMDVIDHDPDQDPELLRHAMIAMSCTADGAVMLSAIPLESVNPLHCKIAREVLALPND